MSVEPLRYDRKMLNQVRLGKGKCVKEVQDYIQANAEIRDNFLHARKIEIMCVKTKEIAMWSKDAQSKIKRVSGDKRDLITYTNPMGTRQIPNQKAGPRPPTVVGADRGASFFS